MVVVLISPGAATRRRHCQFRQPILLLHLRRIAIPSDTQPNQPENLVSVKGLKAYILPALRKRGVVVPDFHTLPIMDNVGNLTIEPGNVAGDNSTQLSRSLRQFCINLSHVTSPLCK